MTRIPDSDYNLGDSPDNAFENLYVYGKLNYDFNDDASVYGASFFARLVEMSQPLGR